MSTVINQIVGTYHVVYPQGSINQVVSGFSPAALLEDLAKHYPDLARATPVVTLVGGVNQLTFKLPSGEKN